MTPKVSVIVPVYNTEKYLRRCIDSIVNQTLKEIEIIIINDGSVDGSGAICDEYALKDNRIKVIHKANSGVSESRNKGLEIATGEYIGFVDSDDWIDANMYSSMYSMAKTQDIDIVNCDIVEVQSETSYKNVVTDIKKDVILRKKDLEGYLKKANSRHMLWFACRNIIKKTIINGVRFNSNLHMGEETVVMLECIAKSKSLYSMSDTFYYYNRMNENSATKQRFRKDLLDDLQNLYDAKIEVYEKYYIDGYEKDLNGYTYCHALSLLISNEIGFDGGIFERRERIKKIGQSSIFKYAMTSECRLNSRTKSLDFLISLMRKRLYLTASLVISVKKFLVNYA